MDNKQAILDHFKDNWPTFYGRFVQMHHIKKGKVLVRSPLRNDDDNPSFEIECEGQHAGYWTDWGTDERGDLFDFFARIRNLDVKTEFPRVLEGIGQEFNIPLPNGKASMNGKPRKRKKMIRSLKERGISEETARVFQVQEKPGNKMVSHQIIFPVFDANGEQSSLKTHKTGQTKGATVQLYPWKALEQDAVFLVNGEPSVWRSWEAGHRNVLCATGGEGHFKKEWIEKFRNKVVYLALDNDTRGKSGMLKIGGMLQGVAKCQKRF